jgi:hypothetical protein
MFQIKPSCVSPNGELGLFSNVHFSKGNILPLRRPGMYCSEAIADEINEYLLTLCNTPEVGLDYEQHVNKLRRSYKINIVNKPQNVCSPNWDLIYDNFIVHAFSISIAQVWNYWTCFDWQTGTLQPDPDRPNEKLDALYLWEPIAYDYVYNEDANREQQCVANVSTVPRFGDPHYLDFVAIRDIEPRDELYIVVSPCGCTDLDEHNLTGGRDFVMPTGSTKKELELIEEYYKAVDNYKSKGVLYVSQSRKRLKSLHK